MTTRSRSTDRRRNGGTSRPPRKPKCAARSPRRGKRWPTRINHEEIQRDVREAMQESRINQDEFRREMASARAEVDAGDARDRCARRGHPPLRPGPRADQGDGPRIAEGGRGDRRRGDHPPGDGVGRSDGDRRRACRRRGAASSRRKRRCDRLESKLEQVDEQAEDDD